MAIMTHAKFHFNRLMLTLIFGIWASEPLPPPRAWRTTEKAGPDRVNGNQALKLRLHNAIYRATILFKLVDSYLIAFKFVQYRSINTIESGR